MADVNADTPNPPGGTFDQDANGDLNGRVTDNATERVLPGRQAPAHSLPEQTLRARTATGLAYISKQFVRYGVTTVHHEGGRSARHAAGARQRRPDAPRQLRSRRQGVGCDDRRRHRVRLRRRMDPLRRHIRTHCRRLVLRTHHGAQRPYPGARRLQGKCHRPRRTISMPGSKASIAPASRSTATPMATSRSTWCSPPSSARRSCFPRADARPKITHCTLINDDLVRRMKALDAVPALFTTTPTTTRTNSTFMAKI